jgi:hypothetical protein
MSSLLALAALVRGEGGMLASLVRDDVALGAGAPEAHGPAQLAASGPRAVGSREEYEVLMEAIYEGYLLHYEEPRVMDGGKADLRLLAGDRLYALGLSRLVGLGDVPAVSELADLITISARAQESGERELADAAWMAGARAIGWGGSEEHRRAKELALAGSSEALVALRASAGAPADTRP